MICSDQSPSAGCADDLEPVAGCEQGASESEADGCPVTGETDAGRVVAADDQATEATPEKPTRRMAERALRSIGYSRREAETIVRAGLAAVQGAPASEELFSLRRVIERNTAILKGSKS